MNILMVMISTFLHKQLSNVLKLVKETGKTLSIFLQSLYYSSIFFVIGLGLICVAAFLTDIRLGFFVTGLLLSGISFYAMLERRKE